MPNDATAARVGGGEPHGLIDPAGWYTLGQAARLTGFGRDTLAARCDSGVLPCRRASGVGRGWRKVAGADLLAFLRASGVKGAAAPKPKATAARRKAGRAKLDAALKELGCM